MSADDKVSLRAWVAVTGGLFGCFMAGMNVHVTSAALPEIEGALGATFEEGSWISTAYLVAEISMIPLTAWLVEVFSLRRVMLLGSLVFLLSSLSCALAPNLSTLILIRVIQGASGAVLIPLSMQLILTELPSSRIPLGMALFSLSNSVAQAAGPSIGGWLADAYSWRWIFLLQLLPGIALLAAVAWSIRPRDGDRERLRQADWLGIGAMVAGLGALQIVLEEGGRRDWFESGFIRTFAVLAVLALLLFVQRQLWGARPFINLRLLGSYNFGVSSLAMAVFGAATFGLVFLVPNYLSQLQGFNARQIGDSLILYGLVQLLLAPLLPRLMRWLNPKLLVAGGFAIMALGCWMGAHLNADAGRNVIIPSIVVRGIGQPLIMVALSVTGGEGPGQGPGRLGLGADLDAAQPRRRDRHRAADATGLAARALPLRADRRDPDDLRRRPAAAPGRWPGADTTAGAAAGAGPARPRGAPAGLPDGLLRRLLPFLRGAPGLRPGLADAAPEGLNSVALGHSVGGARGRNRGSAKRPGSGETWR
ncbi:putative MFS transporter [Pseudomonas aeruginosa]|nr:putative MFS transporter [Pseudomonas aeruginosa]